MAKPTFKMDLIGAKELEAALMELPKALAKAAIRRALVAAAKPMADDMARGAAAAKPDMAQAVKVTTQLSRRQKRGRVKHPGVTEVFVGVSPGRLAHLIEFGSGPRYQKKTGRYTGQMPATPFARPAWDGNKTGALDDFGRLLGIEIENTARRLARKQAKRAKK